MPDQLLKICFVAPLPPPSRGKGHSCGGIAHWTQMVCDYAKNRKDVQITVIDTLPRWRSLDSFPVWKRALSGGYQLVLSMVKLCFLLSTQRIDVIHLTTRGQLGTIRDIGIMLVSKFFRKPVVYHIRYGQIPQISKEKNREWRMMSYAIMKAYTVIAIDKSTRDAIIKHLPMANIELIPNCINLSELHAVRIPPKSLQNTLLFVGWVIPTKGIAELLEAWAYTKLKNWQLQIVGPYDEAYQQALIVKYQIEGVQFLGELSHDKVIETMAACDLFVLPSYTEGFPNVVLEAMACGKAIVATDVGAIPEMLDGNCGRLIQPKDVHSLIKALQALLNNCSLRTKMGERANMKVLEEYSIRVVFASYMTLWYNIKNNYSASSNTRT